jgi:hypothetical protein
MLSSLRKPFCHKKGEILYLAYKEFTMEIDLESSDFIAARSENNYSDNCCSNAYAN